MGIEFWKIGFGVFAYILGQAVLQFVFRPIKQFNKERGDTSYLLLFYQPKITNKSETDEKAAAELSEMGAALLSTMSQIPLYGTLSWTRMFGLPSKKAVVEAAQEINVIVRSLHPNEQEGNSAAQNVEALEKIAQLLKIKTTYR